TTSAINGGYLAGVGGTTTVASGAALGITGTFYFGYDATTNAFSSHTLVNNGTLSHTGGYIYGYAATLTNNGTFDSNFGGGDLVISDQSGAGADPIFNNSGNLVKHGSGRLIVDWDFNNSGSTGVTNVDVQAGVLRIQGGGSSGSGDINVTGTLEFNGDYSVGANSTIKGAGAVSFFGGNVDLNGDETATGALSISGGTANFNNPPSTTVSPSSFTVSGGQLKMDRPLSSSTGTLSGGTLTGSGAVTI